MGEEEQRPDEQQRERERDRTHDGEKRVSESCPFSLSPPQTVCAEFEMVLNINEKGVVLAQLTTKTKCRTSGSHWGQLR